MLYQNIVMSLSIPSIIVHRGDARRTNGPERTVSQSVGRESPRKVFKAKQFHALDFSQFLNFHLLVYSSFYIDASLPSPPYARSLVLRSEERAIMASVFGHTKVTKLGRRNTLGSAYKPTIFLVESESGEKRW